MTKHELEESSKAVAELMADYCETNAEMFHISVRITTSLAVMNKIQRDKFLELVGQLYDHAVLTEEVMDAGEIH